MPGITGLKYHESDTGRLVLPGQAIGVEARGAEFGGAYMLKGLRLAAIMSLALSTLVIGAGAAAASEGHHRHPNTCTGTLAAPGVLAGTYRRDVVVTGVCAVNGGAAVIKGDLVLAPGSALNATFALNDVAGTGTSSLTVRGDIKVGNGATLGMGCEPSFDPCTDDPNAGSGGTLTGQNHVSGDVKASRALAVIIHASKINGDLTLSGGGGGVTCAIPTTGIFAALQSPVFSDSEDNTIGGDLKITGLRTCWMGALRNHVRGDLFDANNTMADPDAGEVLTNVVRGNIACFHNSPVVQYGDSAGSPNQVRGHAFGECAFNVRQPNPAPSGPLEPISVKI